MLHSKGFGLSALDLLIVMATVGVASTLLVPGSNHLLSRHQLSNTYQDLENALSLAREQSQARGIVTRVCPSSNGSECRDDGRWDLGWLVYSDANGDHQAQEFERVQEYPAPSADIGIEIISGKPVVASFDVDGNALLPPSQPIHFRICHHSSGGRALKLDESGLITEKTVHTGECPTG